MGYKVQDNIAYQHNQSAMKIVKNSIQSMGQKLRHIKSRYFFIEERAEKNKIKIEYCQTEKMLADFFTKPLQGKLFRRFRDATMGHKHINTLLNMVIHKTTSKEHVGENKNADTTWTGGDDISMGEGPRKTSHADVVRGTGKQIDWQVFFHSWPSFWLIWLIGERRRREPSNLSHKITCELVLRVTQPSF